MKFIKLLEIMFDEGHVITKGHALINLDQALKITKERDPAGEYCTRILVAGLERPQYFRETPEQLILLCSQKTELPKPSKEEFEVSRPDPKRREEREYPPESFMTNVGTNIG